MSLKLYIGCMFSGKTSKLIEEYENIISQNKIPIVINFQNDNRYGNDNYVYSHDLKKIPCIKAEKLLSLDENIFLNCDYILINEGQFFVDILEFCTLWSDKHKKNIIVCGLNGDYLRKPFQEISNLISICDQNIKLNALCVKCDYKQEALFTKRITNDKERIVIGTNNYIPVCRKHYLE